MSLRNIIVGIVRVICCILFPYRSVGTENIPAEGGAVLCSNHLSMVDPVHLILAQKKRYIYFMAKKELFPNAFAKWLFHDILGAFAVDRQGNDKEAVAHAIDLVKNGELMGIFPEGTRSKDGKLGRGKAGAVMIASRTNAPVIPCCVLRKDNKLRLFSRTTVVYGKPMSLEELHLKDERPDLRYASRLLMERIATLMEEHR
ncbi:MAG: 1-acyl-sn-glycerol-3-phosphate acyltransferase [Clostridia bacterium]|nr:1-acyl-sn-glycerol-3-phosphate acyltransferase [Clostridia bacterium]